MRSRFLLLAVALPVLAAAPVHGQTIFRASGGNVIFNPSSISDGVVFQVFLDALGNHTLIFNDDGTSYSMPGLGQVANTSLGALGALNLGSFAAGTALSFSYFVGGVNYTTTAAYHRLNATKVYAQYVSGDGTFNVPGETNVQFTLTGISKIENGGCTVVSLPAIACFDTDPTVPVTGTPEPGTIALMATGLAGLIPVVRRRRRSASPS